MRWEGGAEAHGCRRASERPWRELGAAAAGASARRCRMQEGRTAASDGSWKCAGGCRLELGCVALSMPPARPPTA